VFKLFLLTNSVHRYIVAGWDSMRPTRNPTRPIGAIKRHAHIESRRSPFPIPINKPSNVRASRHIPGTPSATDNILIGGTERHCVLYGALSTRYDSGCACLVPPDPGLAIRSIIGSTRCHKRNASMFQGRIPMKPSVVRTLPDKYNFLFLG
ncbi:hypothetical protein ACXM96_006987, partial [Pseudomonas aeruginosa]